MQSDAQVRPMIVGRRQDAAARLRRFLRGGGVAATLQTLFVNLLILALNAATGIVTARALGAAGRGQYTAMILWPQFLALTLSLGLPSSLLFHGKRDPHSARELFSAALILSSLLSVPAALIGVFVIPRWMAQYPAEVVGFAQWTMLLMPLAMLTELSIAAFRAREEFTVYNRLRLLTPVLTLAGFILSLAASGLTPRLAALVNLAACSLVGAWFTLHHVRALRPRFRQLPEFGKRLLPYGARAWGNDLLVNLSLQVDALLVVAFLSPDQMGIYTAALSLARMLNVFQTAVVNVLLPKIAGRPAEEALRVTRRALIAATALAVVAGIGLSVFAEPLLRMLYGAEFTRAIPVFRVLVAETIIGCAAAILLQPFPALGRPGVAGLLQGAGPALSVPLMLWLIPAHGLLGAGLALLIAGSGKLILTWIGWRMLLRRKVEHSSPRSAAAA